jgi:hypothetical protein
MDAAVSSASAIICAKLCRNAKKTIKNRIVGDCISLNLKLGFNVRSAFCNDDTSDTNYFHIRYCNDLYAMHSSSTLQACFFVSL